MEEVRIVKQILAEVLDDFAFNYQNPFKDGRVAPRTLEQDEGSEIFAQRRCELEGLPFQVGDFKMNNVWWLSGRENPYLNAG